MRNRCMSFYTKIKTMRVIIWAMLAISCVKANYLPQETVFVNPQISNKGINVKDAGAVGNGVTDDWPVIQAAIDSAVKIQGSVYIPRGRYRLSRPLMVYNWENNQYRAATVKIYGDDNMWSGGSGITVLLSDHNDGFGLGVQVGKGVIIEGLFFQGKHTPPNLPFDSIYRLTLNQYRDIHTTVRSTRFSPYAAVVIDPFTSSVPADGGYPAMTSFYRGPLTRSGSTGVRVEDCTFWGWYVGAVTSPNGYTQNAELCTFENIRVTNCVIGFSGSQAQEKLNRVINVGAWGVTHTLFVWNTFGQMQPGHWVIDGVNVAGQVVNLVHRSSGSFFPLHIYNVYAESLGSIGWWGSGNGDAIHASSINFVYPHQVKSYTIQQLSGVTFDNSNIRYYGEFNTPITFGNNSFNLAFDNSQFYCPPVWGKVPGVMDSIDMGGYYLRLVGYSHPNWFQREPGNVSVQPVRVGTYVPQVNDQIILVNMPDNTIWGQAKVRSSSPFVVDFISPFQGNNSYYYYVYKKK